MSVKSLQGRRTTYATRIKLMTELQNTNAKTNEYVNYKLDYCIFRHLKQFGLYTLRYHVIIFDIFCWRYLFRKLSALTCASFAAPVQKCNNVTDLYELPDFCPLNSPDLSTFISKYGAASLAEKAQDVDDSRQNLFDA